MRKKLNLLFETIIFCFIFIPFYNVKAISSYSVQMVGGSASNKVIGSYNSYDSALDVMNKQNSSNSLVATIFKDGVPVDSKYAIFKFKPSGKSTYPLYRNSNSTSAFTSINSSYGIDAALLGYSENGRVKIMISGFVGYTDINNGTVTPISLLGGNMINVNGQGVNLRSDHSLSSSSIAKISGSYNFSYTDEAKSDGYTWYKINYNGNNCWVAGGSWVTRYDSSLGTYYNHYGPTGNLIHHFTTYGGVNYSDSFTNLGTSPTYLTRDIRYYSFDGNYFYNNITDMLDDYRTGSYGKSVNSNSPHYPYYVYLTSKSTTGYTAADFDNVIASKYNASQSKLYGTGIYFKEAEEKYGTNALLAFSASLNESNWGTSSLAKNKNNLFGYGAADSCPYECAYTYSSPKDSILAYASKSATSYESANGRYYNGSHYGNKSSGKNIYYATDPYWGEIMASNAFNRDKSFGGKDFNSNTIGVTKKGVSDVKVYKNPDFNSYLYTMKNPNRSDSVYDFSVNIIDKINNNGIEFYKIYTDLSEASQFGYVESKYFNVLNNQPVISASDKEIDLNSKFNYLDGVTASDKENGDLTSRITYEGVVDTSKAGNYKVTYTVKDNSNFNVSKTINIKVLENDEVKLEANDIEILQYSKFDYLEGVKAYNSKGNVDVTYEGVVDTSKVGEYIITYKASDVSKKITIKVIKNEKPVIDAKDVTININDEFDYLKNVIATDKEDGTLDIEYEGEVDTTKTGEYKVNYIAADKEGQRVNRIVTITVVNPNSLEPEINESTISSDDIISDEINEDIENLEERDGLFYLDYLKNIDGKLQIKGYNTIEGMNNNLDSEIKYFITFTNVDTEEVFIEEASRITDKKELTKSIYSLDGNDYTYSWFKMDFDFSSIPFGNYIMCVFSISNDSYSYSIINNKLNKPLDSSFVSSDKSVTIRRNYSYEGSPIELMIRSNDFVKKTAGTYYNQFDKYTKFEFISDNRLHLRGVSYSYGANLSSGSNVSRKIIFENVKDYKTYFKNLGSITDGNYNVVLPENDNLDKTRAWYDSYIDLSDLPKGHYVIYITTSSNVIDVYEFTEKLGRNLDNVKTSFDGKNYSFVINKDRGNRIELYIK